MRPDGTDSPGMQSLTWANEPAPAGARGHRAHRAAFLHTDQHDEQELLARALAYLFAAGSIITLVLYAVLPHPEATTAGMLAVVGVALGVGVGIEIAAERIS